MKTKLISTLKKDLLIVEAKDDNIAWAIVFQKYGAKAVADYTLLGKPDEIKEDDVLDLIERVFINYKDYSGKNRAFGSPINSFNSALESEIFWENPFKKPDNYDLWSKYGEYTQYGVGLTTDSLKWHEAQEKTFDKKRTLIFVKN